MRQCCQPMKSTHCTACNWDGAWCCCLRACPCPIVQALSDTSAAAVASLNSDVRLQARPMLGCRYLAALDLQLL